MTSEDSLRQSIATAVNTVKEAAPLSGSITNFVTVDFVANAQLAAGGSAAMVYLPDEGEALGAQSASFYVNLGTLMPSHEEAMCRTITALCDTGTPWVFDPVGIGLGALRERVLMHALTAKPAVIRCNPSEAIALASLWKLEGDYATGGVKGVDSTDDIDAARNAAIALARHIEGAVAVSGPVDLITDGTHVAYSRGGSPLMEKVTGFGCALGGVIAVYAALSTPFVAAVTGSAAFNCAGTRAAIQADAPASFKVAFLDELFRATPEDVAETPLVIEEA